MKRRNAMGSTGSEKPITKKVAVIQPFANTYVSHRKFARLITPLKAFTGSNIFISTTTLHLATLLKKIGCQVRIYNDITEEINPDHVGEDIVLITIVTSSARRGYEIAGLFRNRRVVIGGVHASILPREALQHADQVVMGECEGVLPDLIAGRTKERIINTKPLADLDEVPHIDYSYLKAPPNIISLQTSRGCPFNCSYCSVSRIFGRRYRFRSPGNVLSELLNHRRKYGEIRKIDLRPDADFTCNVERAKEILRRMISEEIKPKSIVANARLEVYKDRHLLSLMSQLNFTICIGIESINQNALDEYNKKQRVSDIYEAIRVFHDNNIKVYGYFIFGADSDEPGTLKHYADFIDKSGLDVFTVTILTPYPGTALHNRLVAQGRIFESNWDYYDTFHVTFKPARMSACKMQKVFNDFYLETFSLQSCLRPKLLFDIDSLKNQLFISLMARILKKSFRRYEETLQVREAEHDRSVRKAGSFPVRDRLENPNYSHSKKPEMKAAP
jgi:radical SAM superfamily enzyme YgiQ (UPF0313 family)